MFEKVNPMHPDKIADRIAGATVDLAYKEASNPRIAVEVLIWHGKCHIIAETSVILDPSSVKKAVKRISGKVDVARADVTDIEEGYLFIQGKRHSFKGQRVELFSFNFNAKIRNHYLLPCNHIYK